MRLALLVTLSCLCLPQFACRKTPAPRQRHTEVMPRDTEGALFFDALGRIPDALRDPLLSDTARPTCARWRQHIELDPCNHDTWSALGFDPKAPATVFSHQGRLALLAHITHPERFEAWRARLAGAPQRQLQQRALETTTWNTLREDTDPILDIARRGDLILLAPGPLLTGRSAKTQTPAADTWLPTPPGGRWIDEPNHRSLHTRLADAEAHVVLRPGAWIAELPGVTMRARELRDRISAQSGHIGIRLTRKERTLTLQAMLLEDAEEPAAASPLGQASGGLPPLGGLIAPGTLGVARVSVQPTLLFALIYGSLPHADRARIDTFLTRMRQDFALDLEDALVRNFRGHAIIALYGLDAFDPGHPDFWRDLVALRATREAVFLPIRDRAKIALVLDALTQLTKGALRRKRVEDAVQYAWFDPNGELQGALLLHDHHVILIDSAPAFARAMAYTRNPAPLATGLSHLDPLLSPQNISGLSLDVSTLRGLLPKDSPKALLDLARTIDRVSLRLHEKDGASTADLGVTFAP